MDTQNPPPFFINNDKIKRYIVEHVSGKTLSKVNFLTQFEREIRVIRDGICSW